MSSPSSTSPSTNPEPDLEPGPPPADAPVTDAPLAEPSEPDGRGRVRKRWIAAALAVVAAVALLAAWRYTERVQAGIDATHAAQDAYVERLERAFETIPVLTDAEIAELRRSRNARHVETAEALGIDPPETRAEADSLAEAFDLVPIETNARYTVLPGQYSVPYLTPSAAVSLDSIAVRFRARLAAAGLPPFRFAVSSGWRTAEDQAALRGGNVNAAAGRSSHEYATTYDITYNPTRYSPAPDALPPPPRVDPRVPGFLEGAVRAAVVARQRRDLDALAAAYPSRLTAALGRALIELEDEGVLITVRERRQPVFHTTVASSLVEGERRRMEPLPARDVVPLDGGEATP